MKHKFTTKAIFADFQVNKGHYSDWNEILSYVSDVIQRPVRVREDQESIEECEEAEADLFAVYLRIDEGGRDMGLNPSYWIADFKTKESADNFSFLIKTLLKQIIPPCTGN